jgi:GNAT superfamily N-acetyltransferase
MATKIRSANFGKTNYMTVSKGEYRISTDKNKMDIDFIHSFLSRSYWAEGITKEVVSRSITGSLCFGVFSMEKQIGFARLITDEATFAYLADVFIDDDHRGKGLSKWLMGVIISHPGLLGLRRILLATRDAHGLYAQFGFTPLNNPERWMHIHNPDLYKNAG